MEPPFNGQHKHEKLHQKYQCNGTSMGNNMGTSTSNMGTNSTNTSTCTKTVRTYLVL